MTNQTAPATVRRRNRRNLIFIFLFYALTAAGVLFLVHVLGPEVRQARDRHELKVPRHKLIAFEDAGRLTVEGPGGVFQVEVMGILVPRPDNRDAMVALAPDLAGLPEDEAGWAGVVRVSRSSFYTWANQRKVLLLDRNEDLPSFDPVASDPLPALVRISGVDVGRKLLGGGQALMVPDPGLPHQEDYLAAQAEARAARRGLWRFLAEP